MYANYLDYRAKAEKHIKLGNERVGCFFLGKAAAFLEAAFKQDEIKLELYVEHLEKIDEVWASALKQ